MWQWDRSWGRCYHNGQRIRCRATLSRRALSSAGQTHISRSDSWSALLRIQVATLVLPGCTTRLVFTSEVAYWNAFGTPLDNARSVNQSFLSQTCSQISLKTLVRSNFSSVSHEEGRLPHFRGPHGPKKDVLTTFTADAVNAPNVVSVTIIFYTRPPFLDLDSLTKDSNNK